MTYAEKQESWEWLDSDSAEYQAAYDVIRYAMTQCWDNKFDSKLERLKTVLEKAFVFVNEEMGDMPEQVQELGLDKWEQEDKEWQEEREEEWQWVQQEKEFREQCLRATEAEQPSSES